jgi:hypothetical protein
MVVVNMATLRRLSNQRHGTSAHLAATHLIPEHLRKVSRCQTINSKILTPAVIGDSSLVLHLISPMSLWVPDPMFPLSPLTGSITFFLRLEWNSAGHITSES